MSRQKKKFRPGQELKQVFEAVEQRRDSARAKFLARKDGLKGKEKKKELMKAEKLATTEETAPRKNRLKKDPTIVEEQAKAIMESSKTQ